MTALSGRLEKNWLNPVRCEFDKPYMSELEDFLRREKDGGHEVYPKDEDICKATLTVRKDEARSDQDKGWEKFTDAVIRAVNEKNTSAAKN